MNSQLVTLILIILSTQKFLLGWATEDDLASLHESLEDFEDDRESVYVKEFIDLRDMVKSMKEVISDLSDKLVEINIKNKAQDDKIRRLESMDLTHVEPTEQANQSGDIDQTDAITDATASSATTGRFSTITPPDAGKKDKPVRSRSNLLHAAAKSGNLTACERVLGSGAVDVNAFDAYGMTALHYACEKYHLAIAHLLIKHGANVSRASVFGWTPMELACKYDRVQVAKLLIESGVDVNGADRKGITHLSTASANGRLGLVRLLVEKGAEVDKPSNGSTTTPLYQACSNGHLAVAEALLEGGADVNRGDQNGWRPLHAACMKGHVEVAQLLIVFGADVNVANNDGFTPLHGAIDAENPNTIELLLMNGADMNTKTKQGRSPQDIANSYATRSWRNDKAKMNRFQQIFMKFS